MVTPHLPPYQAANALLPHVLGLELTKRRHSVSFLTFKTSDPARENTAYVTRRTAEGKTKPEIIRCLKRLLAREVWSLTRDFRRPALT